jgi:hypothetical protein
MWKVELEESQLRPAWAKLSETNWAWWSVSVIPAVWQAKIGVSQSEDDSEGKFETLSEK